MSEDEYIYPDSDSEGADEDGDQYDYGSDGDNYDYGSDGNEDDEGGGNGDEELGFEVELTNLFYIAEDHYCEKRWEAGLKEFLKIIEMEKSNPEEVSKMNEGPYSFLSMARVVMIQTKLGKTDEIIKYYKQLLGMMNMPSVTANQRERAVDDALQALSVLTSSSEVHLTNDNLSQNISNSSEEGMKKLSALGTLYDLTLEALEKSNNIRLWFKTSMNQAKLCLKAGEFERTEELVQKLYEKCKVGKDGLIAGNEDKIERASDLMEVYAIHIDLLYQTKRYSRMKVLYPKTKSEAMKGAVEDVRVTGKLRELGGRMFMRSGQWKLASEEFFQSFNAYNEAGKANDAVTCLKYLVISNIISNNPVNPFDTKEIRAFTGNPMIDAMRDLRLAYQSDDIEKFTNILNHPPNHIKDDSFIQHFLSPILLSIRNRVLLRLLKPYRRVSIRYLAEELRVDQNETEALLAQLILDRKVKGKIDQNNNIFLVQSDLKVSLQNDFSSSNLNGNNESVNTKKVTAIKTWIDSVNDLTSALNRRLD
eukprot:g4177.t1